MSENKHQRVSAVIPARNEQENIARAVRSVAAQAGVQEILVVDDQSQDGTREILQELKSEIPALRTIRVELLPEGWLGKTYALATASTLASGDWLLFTDADTVHRPGSLEALLERAERERADMLSISPAQRTPTWWEKSVIPLVYTRLAGLYRFEEVSDPNSPAAAANGQYLLVRRASYERAGGHEAVRGEILEDVELARRVKAVGGRIVFLPGVAWVETRMYASFREMWRGWTKNLYLLYGRKSGRVFADVAESALLDAAPPVVFVALALAVALGRAGGEGALAAAGCFLLAVWRRWQYSGSLDRLAFDPRLARFQFIGGLLFCLLLLNSLRAHRWSGRVRWKDREYSLRELAKGAR